MRTYETEFPDYDDDMPFISGFVDDSWHNDVCPSLRYDFNDGSYLKLFCDYKNFGSREVGGDQYALSYYENEEVSDEVLHLMSTDDINEIKKFVKYFIASNTL